jgi:hypothetical protein
MSAVEWSLPYRPLVGRSTRAAQRARRVGTEFQPWPPARSVFASLCSLQRFDRPHKGAVKIESDLDVSRCGQQ